MRPLVRTDYTTKQGAEILAHKIRKFWLDRGYFVEVSVVPVPLSSAADAAIEYCVRTNLINGLPEGWRGKPKLKVSAQ